jgi:hypothetical protein
LRPCPEVDARFAPDARIAAIRTDLDRERSRADATIEAMTGERDLLRGHVDTLRAAADQAQRQRQEAQDAAEARPDRPQACWRVSGQHGEASEG